MKFISKPMFILLSSLLFLAACSESSIPEEGKQYVQLPENLQGQGLEPVTEVFSLGCGHCRKMEDFIPVISEKADADIGKMHIVFNQSAQFAAMFYYAAEMQLKATPDHDFMLDLFNAMQMSKETPDEEKTAAMADAFTSRGLVSPFDYNEQQSAELIAKVDEISQLSQRTKIDSVPTFVVNGRYQVLVAGHKDPAKIAETISYLLQK
ncbi:thiol:disulfide interchange protein DsbA/DsbL [Psychromonas ossibalaenae]|uniref:thiol:disulfide interchange protein DsbA/DsbL n=1 Tax=Psychromonas ossibalaenae TaxID=444922 RepID=UPI000363E2AC|nr:thiol:disulfide interchange protein DsbA/DsbL [Psychromonas ossibalaenae]